MLCGALPAGKLPGERRQSRYVVEVTIPCHKRKIKLAGCGGDPNIVVGNKFAYAGEFRLYLTVHLAGVSIRHQWGGILKKIADQSQLYFPPLCAVGTIMEFA